LRIYRGDDTPVESVTSDEKLLGQYIPLHYHFNMLQDDDRVNAFRRAIDLSVHADMHVVELGSGTGILASFAARRGAQVTCVERNYALVKAAREFIALNGLTDRISVIHCDASHYVPESPVDVVICEMLHVALIREKQGDVIHAFKNNHKKKYDGRLPLFLPEASVLTVQPIEHDFDFSGYWAPVPLFQSPRMNHERTKELASLTAYATFDYSRPYENKIQWQGELVFEQEGHFNAFRFVTQNVVRHDAIANETVLWPNQCLVIPIKEPRQVRRGERCTFRLDYSSGDSLESFSAGVTIEPLEQELRLSRGRAA
jgi:predicted RNA methylase